MFSWPHEMFTVSLLGLFFSAGVSWLSLGFISMLSYDFQSPFYHCDHVLRGKCYHCLRQDVESGGGSSQIGRSRYPLVFIQEIVTIDAEAAAFCLCLIST